MFVGVDGHAALVRTELCRHRPSAHGRVRQLDDAALTALVALATARTAAAHIVVLGCGTSGRIAHLSAIGADHPSLASVVAPHCAALVRSDEQPEDNAELGAEAYRRALGGCAAERALVVGVSAGLAADFVGGALAAALADGAAVALLGCTVPSQVRHCCFCDCFFCECCFLRVFFFLRVLFFASVLFFECFFFVRVFFFFFWECCFWRLRLSAFDLLLTCFLPFGRRAHRCVGKWRRSWRRRAIRGTFCSRHWSGTRIDCDSLSRSPLETDRRLWLVRRVSRRALPRC